MKTKILIFITALTAIFSSCSSDSDEDNNNNPTNFFIKAKVNGQSVNLNYYAQATLFGTGNNKTLKLYAGNSLANIYPFFSFDIDNITQIQQERIIDPHT